MTMTTSQAPTLISSSAERSANAADATSSISMNGTSWLVWGSSYWGAPRTRATASVRLVELVLARIFLT